VVAPISGRLSDKYGSRWFMTVGPLLGATGMALLLRTQPGSPYLSVVLPGFVVLASGLAMTMTPMTAAVMGSVEIRHAGVASAATNTSREVGGVFGIALLGAVVTAAFRRSLLARLIAAGLPKAAAAMVVAKAGAAAAAGNAHAAPPGDPRLGRLLDQAVPGAFVHAIHIGMLVAVGFMILASAVSVTFVRTHVRDDDAPVVAAH
jgi:MFS family permease